MHTRFRVIRRLALYFMALLLAVGYPAGAMAQTPPEGTTTEPVVTETTSTPPASTETTAVTEPPKEPEHTYTYDPNSKTWSTEEWQYNPLTGTYDAVPKPVVVEPTIEDTATAETELDVETNVTVNNGLDSDAISGDATVASNTAGGNATSGDAAAMATMVTSVNSVINSAPNQEVAQFTQDIYGDVTGDIMLYPMLLKTMLEQEIEDKLKINATTNLEVNNNLDLLAQSGDATVTSNTNAGNATTGSATAVANLLTILNSMIATQQSFIGTINIYGNLNGDILVAPDFIPQMIASNGVGSENNTQLSTDTTTTIMNNISTMAESGAAAVIDNTKAGNATSGTADTNVVIFNMTGHDIVAENSLLVFVNVLGQWVGVIVDAPAGATAAMLGTGVVSSKVDPSLSIEANTNHTINNNVNVTAITGDAEVSKNTQAGNATTGAAMAAANIGNMSGSQLSLSGWFGVLFINVFQNWFGSFGVNTAYGDPIANEEGKAPAVIRFVPKENNGAAASTATTPVTLIDSRMMAEEVVEEEDGAPVATLLSATTNRPATPAATQPETIAQDYRLWVIAGSLIIMGASAVGLRRLFFTKGNVATLE